MHYYQFNIKDYRKDTGHLSLIEHAIYRSLIDSYYLNELPLSLDKAKLMRSHCVRTDEEKEAFNAVINDFFNLEDDGYHHEKCDEILASIYEKSEKARASAKIRWEKHNAKSMRTHSERNANGMLPINPIPNNPLPTLKDKPQKSASKKFKPPTVSEVREYCNERANFVDAESFVNYYESSNWFRGKTKIKNWKACVITWEKNAQPKNTSIVQESLNTFRSVRLFDE